MHRVVRIAPLLKLPRNASIFDYLWDIETEPVGGMVVQISFRRRAVYGVVVAVQAHSTFKLKSVEAQQPAALLTPLDVRLALDVSRRMESTVGSLFIHMLPQLTKKTILECATARAPDFQVTHKSGTLQYAWLSNSNTTEQALSAAVLQRASLGPIAVVTATQEQAVVCSAWLAKHTALNVIQLRPDSAPQRRAAWCAWVAAQPNTVLVGTHLACWLPHASRATFIILESSHPAHEQWDGARCTNRQILEARRIHFTDAIVVLDHSPDTVDLARVTALPTLAAWPTIIDRTADEPQARTRQWSPTLDEKISAARRTLFFVTHLNNATHQVCRDCGKLIRSDESQHVAVCSSCHSVRLVDLGFGGKKLVSELRALSSVITESEIALLDVKKFNERELNDVHKKIIIATAPLFDRLPLTEFDLIIDVTADFELLHPDFDSEERLWKRLRAMSVRLGAAWSGKWFAETRHSELAAWRLVSNAGFKNWWQHEESLRKRFKQRPFTELDFSAEI